MKKFPVMASVAEVFAGVFHHFAELVRVAWLPLILWLVISYLGNWIYLQKEVHDPAFLLSITSEAGKSADEIKAIQAAKDTVDRHVMPVTGIWLFVEYLTASVVAVVFHRFVLLGNRNQGIAGTGFSYGRPELLYFWTFAKIGIVAFVGCMVALVIVALLLSPFISADSFKMKEGPETMASIAQLGGLLFVVAFSALFSTSRMVLLLPHVALGFANESGHIWRATKGNGLRLTLYMMIVFSIILAWAFIINWPVRKMLGMDFLGNPADDLALANNLWLFLASNLLTLPFVILSTMLSITMLSVAYREIIGLPTAPEMKPE